jgi:superfamily II DNA or RNA helicase
MSLTMNLEPLTIWSGAAYDDTPALRARYTFVDRFDEMYNLFYEAEYDEGPVLLLPRNCSPIRGGPTDHRDEGTDVHFENNFIPRNEEQERVVREVCEWLDKDVSHICQAMTGFGKTYVGCAAAAHIGKRTCIITTKQDIIKQWAQAAKDVLGLKDEDIGYVQGEVNSSAGKPFVIMLVQSALKGPDRYDKETFADFGLVIPDEVHRMGAEQFSQCMWHLNAKLRLGLSATPYRKDGRDVVFRAHIGEVLVQGRHEAMVPVIVRAHSGWEIPTVNHYGVMRKVPHDFGRIMSVVKHMGNSEPRNRFLCRFISSAYKKDRNTIVFCDTTKHLENLQTMLNKEFKVPKNDMGLYVGLQYYKGKKHEKEAQREKVKGKKIILATYKMCSEATDIPWLDCAVLGTPKSDVNQIVGRIRREWPDKLQPVVFDPLDEGSRVLTAYAGSRKKWYEAINAHVKNM